MKKVKDLSQIQKNSARQELFELASLNVDDILHKLNTSSATGLSHDEVQRRQERDGLNVVKKTKKDSALTRLAKSFATPFTLILLSVAIISGFISYYFPESNQERKTWFLTPLIILIMVVFSGMVSFINNTKSMRSAKALQSMTQSTSTVIRDSQFQEIPNGELVVGDIVRLSAGDMLPADLRIIESKDLFVSQSSLTGESNPVEKKGAPYQPRSDRGNIFDITSLAFQGSNVVSGQGVGCVVSTGSRTIFGELSKKVNEKAGKTAFERGIDSIAKLLFSFMGVMVPLIFIIDGIGLRFGPNGIQISGYQRWPQWIEAFVFALTVAVGLTPALLPMQVAANLSKGALRMAKKKVIVKDINTIQNFGAMDVLCTDKTGTLTENSSALCNYYSFDHLKSERILEDLFLNSFFQTGIKSTIDKSILSYCRENRIDFDIASFQKLDEIPFDFERKRLSVLLSRGTERFLISKGSVSSMLKTIGYIESAGKISPVTEADKQKIEDDCLAESKKGRRVLLLCYRSMDRGDITLADETNMVFEGYAVFEDKPKESARATLDSLRKFGVNIKVLTGDSLESALAICEKTGFQNIRYMTGDEIDSLDDEAFAKKVETIQLFAKLTPDNKERIVKALQKNGHVVGFMGDGINDAIALHKADIGISFKDATDIAKDSADIIMMENDLQVLEDGIIEGRKSYVNMMKYLKGQTSSNFGNMFSQMIGAIWIPFLPMKALHIIALDIITDISCAMIPFDKVDEKDIQKPLDFSIKQIRSFMFIFGPLSSIMDMVTFAILMYYIAPLSVGSANQAGLMQFDWGWLNDTSNANYLIFMSTFQTGFFLESLITQNVVYTSLRTDKIPFIQSNPSKPLAIGILVSCLLGIMCVYLPGLNTALDLVMLPWEMILILLGVVLLYEILTVGAKKIYVKLYGRLL